jgi:O-acetyl-ADP-ribose deacetylase (regulator of RNase III)
MVKIINGNLLDATEDIICHQVNCRGAMNSGVAKAIREKWPEVFEAYRAHVYIHKDDKLLGTTFLVPIENSERAVVNMFAQDVFGYDGRRYTSYDAFYDCLEDIRESISCHCSIAFPYRCGSHRGGASWDVIYAMICDVLGDRDVTIYKLED